MRITHLQPISIGAEPSFKHSGATCDRGPPYCWQRCRRTGSHALLVPVGLVSRGRQITKAHPGGYFTYEHPRRLRLCEDVLTPSRLMASRGSSPACPVIPTPRPEEDRLSPLLPECVQEAQASRGGPDQTSRLGHIFG